ADGRGHPARRDLPGHRVLQRHLQRHRRLQLSRERAMPGWTVHRVVCAGLCAAAVLAAHPASAQLISIANTANLGFGQAFIGSSSGTVVVAPAGTRSATGGVTLGSSTSVSAAVFTVSGLPLQAYSISLPGSATLSA